MRPIDSQPNFNDCRKSTEALSKALGESGEAAQTLEQAFAELSKRLKKPSRMSRRLRLKIWLKLRCYRIHRKLNEKLYEFRLRLCLWIKPKSACRSCCLFCEGFSRCRLEIEQEEIDSEINWRDD